MARRDAISRGKDSQTRPSRLWARQTRDEIMADQKSSGSLVGAEESEVVRREGKEWAGQLNATFCWANV